MTKEAEKRCQKHSTSALGSTVVLVIRGSQKQAHRSEMRWHNKPSVKGNIQLGSQSRQIRVLILSLRRSPRSLGFPTASKTGVPDTPSILAFQRCAQYFLLFNTLVGQFPGLTPVCSQTTWLWLSTLEAGDITLSLEWTPMSTRGYRRA